MADEHAEKRTAGDRRNAPAVSPKNYQVLGGLCLVAGPLNERHRLVNSEAGYGSGLYNAMTAANSESYGKDRKAIK
jgi:hypothetical protein